MPRQLHPTDQLERIDRAARRVLAEMGMRVENRLCLEALEAFGARIDFPKERAVFPPEVIDRMLNLVRNDHAGWTRSDPRFGRDLWIGSGGCCPFIYDDDRADKRRAREADCIQALKIVETSPVVASGPPVYNADCSPKFEAIRCLQLGLETFNKTQLGGIDLFFPEQVPFAVELGRLYKNDPTRFLPAGNCPTSPLIVAKTIADLAVAKAPYKKFYAVPTMPVSGANAPITPEGTAVIGVAEILGGYVLAKALNPETPVGSCALSARMDMKTGEVIYVAPEVLRADLAIVETMEIVLKLPCSTFGVYIDAVVPGLQAVREKLIRSLGLGIYGQLTGFEGTLDKGRVFSPTQLMIDYDLHRFFAAATNPPEMSEDTLGVEAILKTAWDPAGYLTSDHTVRFMRQSESFNAETSEANLLNRARTTWQENLTRYEPPNHSREFLRDLKSICDRARNELEK